MTTDRRADGAARKTHVVVTSLGYPVSTDNILAALAWVIDDWKVRRQNNKYKIGVISLSVSAALGQGNKLVDQQASQASGMLRLFSLAIQEGLLPVVSTGNKGHTDKEINNFPAIFASDLDFITGQRKSSGVPSIKGLLPVSGVDNSGQLLQIVSFPSPKFSCSFLSNILHTNVN